MFHELIMALNGFPGDIFQVNSHGVMKTRKDVAFPFLHSGEVIILDEVLEIATLYKNLEEFVEKNQLLSLSGAAENQPQGLYVTSVCNGIREILDEYLDLLAELELKILQDLNLTLNHLRASVEKYRSLFQCLTLLVNEVKNQSKSSTVIVEVVKSLYDEKIHLQDQLQRLIPWVNRTLFKQITNWTVYGTLRDPYNEFFIQRKKEKVNDSLSSTITSNPATDEHYYVNYSVVPSHFSVALTERILFVGNAISILEKSDRTKSVVMEQQKLFHSKMKSVSLNTFRAESLSTTIDELATSIGKVLHNLVIKEAQLVNHLEIIKDFYLTGRGELFHDFLTSLKLVTLIKNTAVSDFRNAFAVSAARVQLQEDVLQKIELTVSSDATRGSLTEYISKLSLKLKHDWPLHVFFTEESEAKYNELFRFLLKVRLLQMELNNIWVETRKIFRFPIQGGPAELKNIMSFFIDHLQHYLQEDVLENQYVILMNAVKKSETFEQIRVAHAQFQTEILAQAFQTNKKMNFFLETLLNLGSKYTAFMSNHIEQCELKNLPVNEGITEPIREISATFKMNMELLLNLLKSLAYKPQNGQYLGQFLLRLDFNSYFTNEMGSDKR